jgi:chromosome segregation ATPase
MKKTILLLFMIIISCANPNMQEGLDNLRSQLSQISNQINTMNLNELTQKVNELKSLIENLVIEVDSAQPTLNTLQETLSLLLIRINELPTEEEIQDVLSTIEEIQSGIDVLVARADYDIDGVINAIDECPDTPISEINDVNEVGCSPSQIG